LFRGEFDFAVSNCDDVSSLVRVMIIMLNGEVEKNLNVVIRSNNIQSVAGNFMATWALLIIVPNFSYCLERYPQKAEFILRLIVLYPELFNFNAFMEKEFETMLWEIIPTVLVPLIQKYLIICDKLLLSTNFVGNIFKYIKFRIDVTLGNEVNLFRCVISKMLYFCFDSILDKSHHQIINKLLDLIVENYSNENGNINEICEKALSIDTKFTKQYFEM
jgi:hypothetical protein